MILSNLSLSPIINFNLLFKNFVKINSKFFTKMREWEMRFDRWEIISHLLFKFLLSSLIYHLPSHSSICLMIEINQWEGERVWINFQVLNRWWENKKYHSTMSKSLSSTYKIIISLFWKNRYTCRNIIQTFLSISKVGDEKNKKEEDENLWFSHFSISSLTSTTISFFILISLITCHLSSHLITSHLSNN